MKRILADWVGNYIFFVPLVILFNGFQWHWSWDIIRPYLVSSVLFSLLAGPLFVNFLTRVWYPIWRLGV